MKHFPGEIVTFVIMKAPISKKVRKILSNKKSAQTLMEAVMSMEGSKDSLIEINGKTLAVRCVGNYSSLHHSSEK